MDTIKTLLSEALRSLSVDHNKQSLPEVEINFFNNSHVGQVISNVYFSEKISTCREKKIGTISFEVKFGNKFVKCTSYQKALNLQNNRSRVSYFENQVFVHDVMSDVNVT